MIFVVARDYAEGAHIAHSRGIPPLGWKLLTATSDERELYGYQHPHVLKARCTRVSTGVLLRLLFCDATYKEVDCA